MSPDVAVCKRCLRRLRKSGAVVMEHELPWAVVCESEGCRRTAVVSVEEQR